MISSDKATDIINELAAIANVNLRYVHLEGHKLKKEDLKLIVMIQAGILNDERLRLTDKEV